MLRYQIFSGPPNSRAYTLFSKKMKKNKKKITLPLLASLLKQQLPGETGVCQYNQFDPTSCTTNKLLIVRGSCMFGHPYSTGCEFKRMSTDRHTKPAAMPVEKRYIHSGGTFISMLGGTNDSWSSEHPRSNHLHQLT